VLEYQCKSRDSASVNVNVQAETVLEYQCKSRDSASVSTQQNVYTLL